MSKELIERIKAFKFRQYEIAGWCHDDAVGLLTACQQRIEELEQAITELGIVRADAECEAEMQTARAVGLEQENTGLKAELDGWKDGSEAAQNEYAALILRSNHRIEELEQQIATMQSDINGWLVIKGNMTKHQQELEQENSRLQGRVEAEAQSGMQSLRTQENLFGAKLDALQAQLEAASGYLGRLLTTVWPQIELCPDLMGICTQIDHLLASLRDNRVKEDKEKV